MHHRLKTEHSGSWTNKQKTTKKEVCCCYFLAIAENRKIWHWDLHMLSKFVLECWGSVSTLKLVFPPKEYEFSCCCCRQLLDSMSEHSLLMRFESGGRHVPITVHNQMQSNLHESTQWRNWNLNRSKNFRTECAVDQICDQVSVCIKYSYPPLASCLQCFQLQWYGVNFLS